MSIKKNNFTTNPDHPNIELYCDRDIFLAQDLFQENFKRIGVYRDGTIEDDLFLYTDNEFITNEPEPVHISRTKNTSLAMAAALDELFNSFNSFYSYSEDIGYWNNTELCEELEAEAEYNDDYLDILDNHGIYYTQNYKLMSVTGHRQGDYAMIIVPTKALKKLWGREPDLDGLQSYFKNLFYSAPIYFSFIIKGENYCLSDFYSHDYDYDKGDIIEAFFKEYPYLPDAGYIKSFLENNLPEYI